MEVDSAGEHIFHTLMSNVESCNVRHPGLFCYQPFARMHSGVVHRVGRVWSWCWFAFIFVYFQDWRVGSTTYASDYMCALTECVMITVPSSLIA